MSTFSTKDLATQSLIAALYVVLVYIFSWISFSAIQFRIAEVLMVLVLFNKKSIIGLTIGCLLANLFFSPTPWDITLGTLATLISGLLMLLFKKKWVLSLLMPALINAIIIGPMLTYAFHLGHLYLNIFTVFAGEFTVLFFLGIPLYLVISKQEALKAMLS